MSPSLMGFVHEMIHFLGLRLSTIPSVNEDRVESIRDTQINIVSIINAESKRIIEIELHINEKM